MDIFPIAISINKTIKLMENYYSEELNKRKMEEEEANRVVHRERQVIQDAKAERRISSTHRSTVQSVQFNSKNKKTFVNSFKAKSHIRKG
jgi:hypothetical protein